MTRLPPYMRPAWQIKGTLQVTCPYCGARNWEKCRTHSGNKLQRPHAARIRKADGRGLLMPLLK